MNVLPRQSWTPTIPAPSIGADFQNGLNYNRRPKGISIHTPPVVQQTSGTAPVLVFSELHDSARSLGRSDIDYNLGVTNNADGIWNLRGLQNVSSASPDPDFNAEFLSVFVVVGTEEKPTDNLLRNILDARRLVLSRYPEASKVDYRDCYNPYLQALFSKAEFWNMPPPSSSTTPVEEFVLPDPEIPGSQSVRVFDLQEQLGYWRYYRVRSDGIYNSQTIDAVKALQADLLDGGHYYYGIDGIYSDHLRRSWLKFLNT